GMAKGIDGAGQRAALNAGGKSYAVLGSGVDVCYPRDHIGLYMDIIEHGGGILSEFPPGTPPLAMNFPMRNRIISGLSDAVLVMEARVRSGSLITADMALEQGKDVYALPGPLDSPLSAGCNQLIQQGAGILLNPENLLEEWGIETNVLCRNTEIKNEKNKKVLESTDDLVYSCVGLYPKNVDQIAQESRVEIRKLMSILVTLELQGYIREITKNYYIRIK
ncbi:MAG: DNA-processing protein DprA, partial [[Ruminococcus] faecis]|nr:DNA-processing protein DprA [Mediterraneibacter faecis]